MVLKVEVSETKNSTWTLWVPCNSENESCFKKRFLECKIGLGGECAGLGDLYKETTSIKCNGTTCKGDDFKNSKVR